MNSPSCAAYPLYAAAAGIAMNTNPTELD